MADGSEASSDPFRPVTDADIAEIEHVPTIAERERAWLADRKTAITASDAAAILGVSHFRSPIDVWLDKTGQLPDVEQTEQQESGHRLQRPILNWYADRKQVAIVHADPFTLTRSATTPLVGATLDAMHALDHTPVDAKNIGYPQPGDWGEEDTDQIPLHYAVQLMLQMHVIGDPAPERARLAVLIRGQELRIYELARNRQLEDDIIAKCVDFHEKFVLTQTPPPVDGTASWTKYIKQMFRANTDQVREASGELHAEAVQLHLVRTEMQALDTTKTLLENKLKFAIGDARTVRGKNWSATHAKTKDGTEVDYYGALQSLALALSAETGKSFKPLLDQAIADNTKATQGFKKFYFNFNDDAK